MGNRRHTSYIPYTDRFLCLIIISLINIFMGRRSVPALSLVASALYRTRACCPGSWHSLLTAPSLLQQLLLAYALKPYCSPPARCLGLVAPTLPHCCTRKPRRALRLIT